MYRWPLLKIAMLSGLALQGGLTPGQRLDASDWYVAVQGQGTDAGTAEAPWDIASALGGGKKIAPGDNVWLRAGTYHAAPRVGGTGYEVRLAGDEQAPIRIGAVPGERVTIDGGLNILPPATWIEIRDLEILVSEPRPVGPVPPDPSYANVNRPWGGLSISSGTGCKFINLVIHDSSQGVSWWTPSTKSELYGCLIYDNGWAGTDRGHGHAIYTQNAEGVKTISDCIMTGGFGFSMHAYGSSRADVDNYLVEGNIVYAANTFLIGGGKPSHGIRVFSNALYGVPMQIGYSAPSNEDCEVRGNTIVDGSLNIVKYNKAVNEGNLVIAKDAPRSEGAKIVLRRNQYDPKRAHLAIFNFNKDQVVPVDAGDFLKPGDRFRLLNPRDFFGKPVFEGTAGDGPLRIPMEGEFAAFVMMRGSA